MGSAFPATRIIRSDRSGVPARPATGSPIGRSHGKIILMPPGQHVGLQTDDAEAFCASLGFRPQPLFMSAISGEWLANEASKP
jgi:hypothetical protein